LLLSVLVSAEIYKLTTSVVYSLHCVLGLAALILNNNDITTVSGINQLVRLNTLGESLATRFSAVKCSIQQSLTFY